MAVRIWREGKQLGLSASRIYLAVGMAFGLSLGGTRLRHVGLWVTYERYLNQYTRTMSNFHICYLIGKDLCTGINIKASSYEDALKRFKRKNKILYICLMD